MVARARLSARWAHGHERTPVPGSPAATPATPAASRAAVAVTSAATARTGSWAASAPGVAETYGLDVTLVRVLWVVAGDPVDRRARVHRRVDRDPAGRRSVRAARPPARPGGPRRAGARRDRRHDREQPAAPARLPLRSPRRAAAPDRRRARDPRSCAGATTTRTLDDPATPAPIREIAPTRRSTDREAPRPKPTPRPTTEPPTTLHGRDGTSARPSARPGPADRVDADRAVAGAAVGPVPPARIAAGATRSGRRPFLTPLTLSILLIGAGSREPAAGDGRDST